MSLNKDKARIYKRDGKESRKEKNKQTNKHRRFENGELLFFFFSFPWQTDELKASK